MNSLIENYTSANSFPAKLIKCEGARRLRPVHVQWIPTNRCNFNCQFCSCRNRTTNDSMIMEDAAQVIGQLHSYGMQAVTITGGGEPLCHPHVADMIRQFSELGTKIGLVTNGSLLASLSHQTLELVTWCRVSNSDERELTTEYRKILDFATEVPIDWAFSHVVTQSPNLDEIGRIVDYAEKHHFTHVRLVGDLLNPDNIDWSPIRVYLQGRDEHVIYQERKTYVPARLCWLGYVKPVITPDFRMYLCCGAQYALKSQTGYFPSVLSMGSAYHLPALYDQHQAPFKVPCDRCYYDEYNRILQVLNTNFAHAEFV